VAEGSVATIELLPARIARFRASGAALKRCREEVEVAVHALLRSLAERATGWILMLRSFARQHALDLDEPRPEQSEVTIGYHVPANACDTTDRATLGDGARFARSSSKRRRPAGHQAARSANFA
jgi:hypothetical protein